jgi:competence protein ComEC
MKIRIILFASLIVLVILFWITLPSKKVEVIFCDVGQGDAALVTYKNWQMLIDTGPNNKKVLACLENNLPFWDKKIELILITHGDSDHAGGLEDISKYYKIEQSIYSKNVSQFDLIKTDWMAFEVVNPREKIKKEEDNNKNSIAGILTYWDNKLKTEVKIFMAADIDLETEQRLVWQGILEEPVGILKVSHHGSKDGTSEELLNVLKPKLAVISVGSKNRFGHPTKEVLDRLKEKGIEVRRTDIEGEVFANNLILR